MANLSREIFIVYGKKSLKIFSNITRMKYSFEELF